MAKALQVYTLDPDPFGAKYRQPTKQPSRAAYNWGSLWILLSCAGVGAVLWLVDAIK